jgi:hypothetical protein
MARNYFIGWTKPDLETALRAAQEELAAGAALTGGAAGDQSFTQLPGNLELRIQRLYYALHVADPVKYPESHCNPTNRTQVVFNDE